MPNRLLLAACAAASCLALASVAPSQDKVLVRGLEAWMKSWYSGKLDLSRDRIPKSSPGVRVGVIDARRAQSVGHLEELKELCRVVSELDSVDAAEALLLVAGAGLAATRNMTPEMRPVEVRRRGEHFLDQLKSKEAHDLVVEIASTAADGELAATRRAAALLTLAREEQRKRAGKDADGKSTLGGSADLEAVEAPLKITGKPVVAPLPSAHRPLFQAALASEHAVVRAAIGEAVGRAGLVELLPALADAVRTETDDAARARMLVGMLAAIARYETEQDALRKAADAAITTLGTGTWHAHLAAVELLHKVRSASSVPALIAVLARWKEGEPAEETDLCSGTLRLAAHEALTSLTGARIPMESPSKWQSWWDGAKDGFEVQPVAEVAAAREGATTTGEFFGIPVRGSRVLFIVDVSGSMAEEFRRGTTGGGGGPKIEVAKRELLKVCSQLTADSQFNCVTFGNGAEMWQRAMVTADERAKRRFEKFVEDMRADGGTNLYEALSEGLDWESAAYGSRYRTDYDEVFVLSDGLPSLGDVRDPREILRLVSETNRFSRLTINTIYIPGPREAEQRAAQVLGMSGTEFMRLLAEHNRGKSIALGGN